MLNRVEPGPGQESCWDYPRPPVVESTTREIRVLYGELEIARSVRALRVLETYGAPVYYLPETDVDLTVLQPSRHTSVCEWKGTAVYFDLLDGGANTGNVIRNAAWSYPEPSSEYGELAGYYSFYPGQVGCFVDGEKAIAQAAGHSHSYGGWVTREIVGPMKGEPGAGYW